MSFPNVIYGEPGDQFAVSSTQQLPLGTRMVFSDGRVFRYFENGSTALKAGTLLQAAPATEDEATFAHVLKADAAAGATSFQLNTTGATGEIAQGRFDEGYVIFSATGSTGMGEVHQLSGSFEGKYAYRTISPTTNVHTWHTVTGTIAEVYLKRGDVLYNAQITETGVVRLVRNPYKEVIVKPAVVTQIPVGVAPMPVAADYFGWCQTWGPCAVLVDLGTQDVAIPGMKMVPDTEDVGAMMAGYSTQQLTPTATSEGGNIYPTIGYLMEPCVDTFHSMVFLSIAP